MKEKGLVTCYICKKQVNVKDVVVVDSRQVCLKHYGVSREVEREKAKIEEVKEKARKALKINQKPL